MASWDHYVFIEQTEFADINTLPLDFLTEARVEFQNNNLAAAGQDIRVAARLIRIQAMSNPESLGLNEAAARLDFLGHSVAKGEVKSLALLDTELTKSAQAEAKHHYFRASQSWARHMTKNVGLDLTAATKSLKRSAEWSGEKIVGGKNDVVAETEKLSDKMLAGGKWTSAEVGKGLKSLGDQINEWGKEIAPSGKSVK